MTYELIKQFYRNIGRRFGIYKFSLPKSVYKIIIDKCNKFKINSIDFINYWNSEDFKYPVQLTSTYYYRQYKNSDASITQAQLSELLFLILRYKWLNGYLLNQSQPLEKFLEKNKDLERAAKYYSSIYLVSYSKILEFINKYYDEDNDYCNSLSIIKLPYIFNINHTDHIAQEITAITAEIIQLQETTILKLDERFRVLLYGGENI